MKTRNNCSASSLTLTLSPIRISSSFRQSISRMHRSWNDQQDSADRVAKTKSGSGCQSSQCRPSCRSTSIADTTTSTTTTSCSSPYSSSSFSSPSSSSSSCCMTSSPMLRKSDRCYSLVAHRLALFCLLALSSCLSYLHMVACDKCELNANAVIDQLLARMKVNLLKEKIVVQNGAITIYDASIVRISDLFRLTNSCARKLDSVGSRVLIPFQAEIRSPHAAAKLKYNAYVADIYGDYRGNFSHIRMNGTLEAHLHEEAMLVNQFNITSSAVISDSIVFGYVPRWILDWVRSYFDNDNTQLYQQLAHTILQREVDNFRDYDLIRNMFMQSMTSVTVQGREDEERLPQNRL